MSTESASRPGTTASRASQASTHTQHSTATHTTQHTAAAEKNASQQGYDLFSRKHILYTGPEGLRPYRRAVVTEQEFVGNTDMSPEHSGNLNYLFRSPKEFPFPKAKNGRIGETGWEMEKFKGFNLADQQ